MFKIFDGRETFYQWDLDRKLIVEDANINEVHFCNRTDECSLVVETYVEDGLTLANVPNILLQTDWKINVYAYDKNYTKHSEVFKVIGRTKPSDYVYTETELKNYNDLQDSVYNLMGKVDRGFTAQKEENEKIYDYFNQSGDAIKKTISQPYGILLTDISKLPQTAMTNYMMTTKTRISKGYKNLLPQPYTKGSHDHSKAGIHFEVNDDYTVGVTSNTGEPTGLMSSFPFAGTSSNKKAALKPDWIAPGITYTFYYGYGGVPRGVEFRMRFYDENENLVYQVNHTAQYGKAFTFKLNDETAKYWYVFMIIPEGLDIGYFYVKPCIFAGEIGDYNTYSQFEEPEKVYDRWYIELDGTEDHVLLTSNAYLSITYNQSTSKVIERLTNAIISLGGNV